MEVVVLVLGASMGIYVDDWRVFAVSVIAAGIMQWLKDQWLHDHIHQTHEGDHHGF